MNLKIWAKSLLACSAAAVFCTVSPKSSFGWSHLTEHFHLAYVAIADPPKDPVAAMLEFNKLRNDGPILETTCEEYGGQEVPSDQHKMLPLVYTKLDPTPEVAEFWGSPVGGIWITHPETVEWKKVSTFNISYSTRLWNLISLTVAPMYSMSYCAFVFDLSNEH